MLPTPRTWHETSICCGHSRFGSRRLRTSAGRRMRTELDVADEIACERTLSARSHRESAVYVDVVNQLTMGSRGTPTMPMFIGQGNGGELAGTASDKDGIGPGDGVMIAGDVRSLARAVAVSPCSTRNTNTSATCRALRCGWEKPTYGSPHGSPGCRRRRTARASRRATRWRRSAEPPINAGRGSRSGSSALWRCVGRSHIRETSRPSPSRGGLAHRRRPSVRGPREPQRRSGPWYRDLP